MRNTGTSARLALCALALFAASPVQSAADGGKPQFEVLEKSIPELQAAMAAHRITSRQLVQAYLDRIKAYDHAGPALNSIVTINPDALEQAAALDRERAAKVFLC